MAIGCGYYISDLIPYLQYGLIIEQTDIMKLNILKHYANFKYEHVKVNTV